jgi:hypothetical protein
MLYGDDAERWVYECAYVYICVCVCVCVFVPHRGCRCRKVV